MDKRRPPRRETDRREGWGPHCQAHDTMSQVVAELSSSLYWIKVISGAILTLAVAAASIGLPMLYSTNRAMSAVTEEHSVRLTKLESWKETREALYPTGPARVP